MSQEWLSPGNVRERLARLEMKPLQSWRDRRLQQQMSFTEAAVLIPLTSIDDEMHIVFTRRSARLRQHSGEISFPGGRADADDRDLLYTALRETHEEIALAPDDVSVFGALVRLPTITGYHVTSFVGEFDSARELVFNPREIDLLFTAPLRHLGDPRNHRVEHREYAGTNYPIHFYEYDDHTIWGATGYMLYALLEYLRGE
jgi:8-oxo-dGTP pyrophosphatase MutT (NUDIX family)